MWGTIQQFWMILTKIVRWSITLDCKMPNLPDILRALFTGIASMAWCAALESTLLGLHDLVWLLRILQRKQNFWNDLVTL